MAQLDIYTPGGVLDQVAALAWEQACVECGMHAMGREVRLAHFLKLEQDTRDDFRAQMTPFVLETLRAIHEHPHVEIRTVYLRRANTGTLPRIGVDVSRETSGPG